MVQNSKSRDVIVNGSKEWSGIYHEPSSVVSDHIIIVIVDPLAIYSLDHASAPIQKDHDDHALVKVRILE